MCVRNMSKQIFNISHLRIYLFIKYLFEIYQIEKRDER